MNFCIMGVSIPIRVSDWVFIILFWLSKNRLIPLLRRYPIPYTPPANFYPEYLPILIQIQIHIPLFGFSKVDDLSPGKLVNELG